MSDVTRTALIIDDDAHIVEVLTVLLETQGFTVETLSDGIQALEIEPKYDVILLDLMMPVFDGERLADYWKLTRPELLERLIVLTGYSHYTRGRRISAFASIPKPFDYAELLRTVEACAQQASREGVS